MNNVVPKKLLNSKWTAVKPVNGEKHFLITKVDFDEKGTVELCVAEAVLTNRAEPVDWKDLKNRDRWIQGWH